MSKACCNATNYGIIIIYLREYFVPTPLITRAGFEALKKELDFLWREERPDVTRKVSWAASLGDRSENADYQYNKKRLREIDRRLRYLRKSLENLKIVDYNPVQEGRVFFGAWVTIENDDGQEKRFRIVGYDEIFDHKDYISIDSPMARALIKKEVDDEVVVTTEAGRFTWYVMAIDYEKTL
jgi:transcription elongation factor GreB